MKKNIYDKAVRINKAKKVLEEELGIEIAIRGKEVVIESSAEKEFIAEQVLDAVNLGFDIGDALLIKDEDFRFEILNIKDYTNRSDLERVRARVIGKKRKALNTIEQLTKCVLQVKVNEVGIIGPAETIQQAQESIIAIIRGAKHSNVYAHLEKNQFQPVVDLGLRGEKEGIGEEISSNFSGNEEENEDDYDED